MNDPGAALWTELVGIGRLTEFVRGTDLAVRNAADAPVVVVIDGLCSLEDADGRGTRILAGVCGRGETALEASALRHRPARYGVRGVVAGRAALIARHDLYSWLNQSPTASHRLAVSLAERLEEDHPPPMSDRTRVEVRLADRIVRLADRLAGRNGVTGEIRVPFTHDDLASWIGATRAVTTRAMGALRDRGLIDHGRGWIRVLDHEALRALQQAG